MGVKLPKTEAGAPTVHRPRAYLRHSAAGFLATAGVPASDAAAQLGHAGGGALALRVYVYPLEESRRRTAEHLDAVIDAAP